MDRVTLDPFVRFHAWANARILETAAALSENELRGPAPLDYGTAFDTLRHLVDVDWSWREFCVGHHVGKTYVWDHGFVLDDLLSITAFSADEDARLARYVASLEPAELDERLSLGEDPDDNVPRWLIIAHVVNHGTQHRSELARYLTDRGHSPGDLDLLDGLRLPDVGTGA
jgi:uncharacterized damage-inducible protein DinB